MVTLSLLTVSKKNQENSKKLLVQCKISTKELNHLNGNAIALGTEIYKLE